jgi:hypothetical protein
MDPKRPFEPIISTVDGTVFGFVEEVSSGSIWGGGRGGRDDSREEASERSNRADSNISSGDTSTVRGEREVSVGRG